MNKLISFCLLLITFVSCRENKSIFVIGRRIVASQPETELWLMPKETISGPFLDGTCDLHCVEQGYLILKLRAATGYCFRALDLQNKKTLDFLSIGRGPDEVLSGYYSGKRTVDGRTILDISAMNEGYLLSVDLEETLRLERASISRKTEMIPFGVVSFNVGNRLLSESINDEDVYSFKLYDPIDHSIFRTFKVFGDEEYLVSYQPLFSSAMVLRPDGQKMSLSMLYFDEINIIDILGDNHLSISSSRKNKDASIIQESLHKKRLGNHYYYMQHAVTNDSIFGLYYDCDVSKKSEMTSVTIHVFSWEGQMKALYHINERLVAITVSDDGKTLYGLTGDETLYVYSLE